MAAGALFTVSEACVHLVTFWQMRRRDLRWEPRPQGRGFRDTPGMLYLLKVSQTPQTAPSLGVQASEQQDHVSAARQDLALVAGYSFRDGLRD